MQGQNMDINKMFYNNNMNMINQKNMNIMNQSNMNKIFMNMMNQNKMNMMNQNNMNMMNQNNMNMMNQNNMNMMNQNNMNMINPNNMNMMNQNNMNIMNQNNMNMMINNPNFMNMNNNIPNLSRNNYNQNFMINNFFNNNQKINKMKQVFEELKFSDPYMLQKGIGKELNESKPYVAGGNKLPDFLTLSSTDSKCNNPEPNSVNIVFVTMQGNRHIRNFNSNDKIRYVLEEAIKSFGLHSNALKKIYFLHNAANLNNLNPNKTLKQLNIVNSSRINVIDISNIIGA